MYEGGAGVSLYVSPVSECDKNLSHTLLCRAAQCFTGLKEADWSVLRTAEGKPFFPAVPQVCFSLTHSGSYWLCAFSYRPLGIDLQAHQPCSRETLSQRFFHPCEDAFLRLHCYRDFFSLWAAKESYLKFTGQGITGGLDHFSVVSSSGVFPALAGVDLRLLPFLPGYSLCLCAQRLGEVEVEWLGGQIDM